MSSYTERSCRNPTTPPPPSSIEIDSASPTTIYGLSAEKGKTMQQEKGDEEDSADVEYPNTPPSKNLVTDEPPDGGRGWLVVLGSMLNTAATFGLVNSWVFQSHYQTNIMPELNPSTIAWIGSAQYALVLLPGLPAGRLFDLGYLHLPLLASSLLVVVSTLLVAECDAYWQFMLTQGIATGIGCGFAFGPAIPVLAHWFKKKRTTAYGIVTSGAAIGGTLFPIAVRRLLPMIGFKWTMRVVALMVLVIFALSSLLIRRRLPPVNIAGGLFNLGAFKSAPFSLYVIAGFIGYLGMYTVLTYIDISAVQSGLSTDFSFYLVALANAGSLLGRVTAGLLSDRCGCLNVLIPFSILAAVTTYVWPYCHSKGSFIALAILYGTTSGAFVGLVGAPVANLGGTGDIGRRIGMLLTICAISSLCGPPISGAIYSRSGGSYVNVGIYAGSTILGSAIFMILTRWKALGGMWGKF